MKIDRIVLWDMKIPFKIKVEHGMAARSFSDSIVIMIQSRDKFGYGEIIIRDYVSGSIGFGKERLANVQQRILRLISPIQDKELSWVELKDFLESVGCQKNELPLLCGIETALYDLFCREKNQDIYQLLQLEPVFTTINYGGILPIVSLEMARKLIQQCIHLRLGAIRVKLGVDLSYNNQILQLCRGQLGSDYPVRVDANCSWTNASIEEHLEICKKYSVMMIEQPMRPIEDTNTVLSDQNKRNGFQFMADESILNMADLEVISKRKNYQLLNLRLSKNGGLSRLLKLAEAASAEGIGYQVGCHVGESGILSAVGRVAASLLPDAVFVDGSYDDYLLSENVTTENLSFGMGGAASIKRGEGFGYRVDVSKLAELSVQQVEC